MKNNYLTVGACLFLSCMGIGFTQAQSTGPEFLDCSSAPISLCVSDDGVRLPSNNKIYLGEENPDATSCSVHVSQKIKVRSTCGKSLQYEVQLFLEDDSTTAIVLKPLTSISTDSLSEAELSFDSEFSPDSLTSKNGLPYTIGCNAYHKIKWIVIDSCGDVAICEKKIYVYDCSKPALTNPTALYVLTTNISGYGWFRLDSLHIDANDDCTTGPDLLYSFYPDHLQSDSMFDICDVPAISVELLQNIWIADEGSDLNCDDSIEWEERNISPEQILIVYTESGIHCGEPTGEEIAGTISTENNQTVEKVAVTLTSPGHVFPTYVTGKDGNFNFSDLSVPEVYTLNAERNDNHRNGVSTLD
ncbi:MAG: carboxypeptidase-like regulatory domain-containing protein, partial [Saprospiraceae bacterium]